MLLNVLNPRRRRLWWACGAAILAAIGLSGCCEKCNLMGSNFADNSLADQVRPYRKTDGDGDSERAGVSSKSQQIEEDLGFK